MSYEAFREQCAKTIELCDDAMMAHDDYVLDPSECAGIVRALPLPEVIQEPTKWLDGGSYAVYAIPPDMTALIIENGQLRYALNSVMQMDVKGYQLQERLQFSDAGREMLDLVKAALKGGAK